MWQGLAHGHHNHREKRHLGCIREAVGREVDLAAGGGGHGTAMVRSNVYICAQVDSCGSVLTQHPPAGTPNNAA